MSKSSSRLTSMEQGIYPKKMILQKRNSNNDSHEDTKVDDYFSEAVWPSKIILETFQNY